MQLLIVPKIVNDFCCLINKKTTPIDRFNWDDTPFGLFAKFPIELISIQLYGFYDRTVLVCLACMLAAKRIHTKLILVAWNEPYCHFGRRNATRFTFSGFHFMCFYQSAHSHCQRLSLTPVNGTVIAVGAEAIYFIRFIKSLFTFYWRVNKTL